jgi:hypothetical protein
VSAAAYSAVLMATVERVGGMDGLLLKEKLGGKSVLSHSLDRFDEDERCEAVVVLAAPAVWQWVTTDPLTFASAKLRVMAAATRLSSTMRRGRTGSPRCWMHY